MNTEGNNESCYYDTLKFYSPADHQALTWRLNKTICGRYSGSFEILNNVMMVNFITDGSLAESGFDVSFSNVCGGTIFASSGVISTEDAVQTRNCEWKIVVKDRRTIQ